MTYTECAVLRVDSKAKFEKATRGELNPGDSIFLFDHDIGELVTLKVEEVPPIGREFKGEVDGEEMWANYIWFEDGSCVLAGSRETFERLLPTSVMGLPR